MKDKILLVDDDQTLLDIIKYNLLKENFKVITALDGMQALKHAYSDGPDLIILDVNLPELNGFEVCRILRKDISVPILILSARTDEVDKVVGLEIGADDYLAKPFGMKELIARIRAALRRAQRVHPETTPVKNQRPCKTITAGSFKIDLSRRIIFKNEKPLQLSNKEFELLEYVIQHRGQVFSREELIETLWGYDYSGTLRTIDVHIRSLRLKIEDKPVEPRHLITVQCIGYKFEE